MLTFVNLWAFALLPVPFIVFLINRRKTAPPAALRLPNIHQWQALQGLQADTGEDDKTKRPWLLAAVWICFTVAVSNPTWFGDPVQQPVEGRDILLTVDISGSMKIRDMQLNNSMVDRLTATKAVISEFIKQRKGDRLGLIVYGEQAYMHVPLTADLETLETLLLETESGFAGDGTAIGDAIGLGLKRLHELNHDQHIMILLTDGEQTAGKLEPLEAAKLAAEQGLKIYTIGVGARQSMAGRYRRPSGVDETTLNQIASTTGGQAFRAQDTYQLMDIYNYIDELEPQPDEAEAIRPQKSLAWYALAVGLAVLTLGLVVRLIRGRGE